MDLCLTEHWNWREEISRLSLWLSYCGQIVWTLESHEASGLGFYHFKWKRIGFGDFWGSFLIQHPWFDFQEFGPGTQPVILTYLPLWYCLLLHHSGQCVPKSFYLWGTVWSALHAYVHWRPSGLLCCLRFTDEDGEAFRGYGIYPDNTANNWCNWVQTLGNLT